MDPSAYIGKFKMMSKGSKNIMIKKMKLEQKEKSLGFIVKLVHI